MNATLSRRPLRRFWGWGGLSREVERGVRRFIRFEHRPNRLRLGYQGLGVGFFPGFRWGGFVRLARGFAGLPVERLEEFGRDGRRRRRFGFVLLEFPVERLEELVRYLLGFFRLGALLFGVLTVGVPTMVLLTISMS